MTILVLGFFLSVWAVWQTCTRAVARIELQNTANGVAAALHDYEDEHSAFPTAVSEAGGGELRSWRSLIGPVASRYHEDLPWNSPENTALAETDWFGSRFRRLGYGCFAVRGKGTMWPEDGGMSIADITDGTHNTIMVIIVPYDNFNWFQPGDIAWDGERLVFENDPTRSVELSRGLYVMADGILEWPNTSEPPVTVMRAMLGYNDGIPMESARTKQDSEAISD